MKLPCSFLIYAPLQLLEAPQGPDIESFVQTPARPTFSLPWCWAGAVQASVRPEVTACSVPGCGAPVEYLAEGFLVSEPVCKSVFNCGQIRGRENTKDLWGLHWYCWAAPLTCHRQALTSFCHLALLSFAERSRKAHFREGFQKAGRAGLVLAGLPCGQCRGARAQSLIPSRLNFGALLTIAPRLHTGFARLKKPAAKGSAGLFPSRFPFQPLQLSAKDSAAKTWRGEAISSS